jgi:uncharacterized Fe-S cluster protein YjdI
MDDYRGPKRQQDYETSEITVTFDPNICRHSGVCVRTLHAVFDPAQKRWVRLENASAAEIAAAVAKCPSGALQAKLK